MVDRGSIIEVVTSLDDSYDDIDRQSSLIRILSI